MFGDRVHTDRSEHWHDDPRSPAVLRQGDLDGRYLAITNGHARDELSSCSGCSHRQPLVSWETVINLIGCTRTRSGLVVKAVLDTRDYETGQEVTPPQFNSLHLKRHSFHPDWNYTLKPHSVK